jgi:hypothetical protein
MDAFRYLMMTGRDHAQTEPANNEIPAEGYIPTVSPHLRNFM